MIILTLGAGRVGKRQWKCKLSKRLAGDVEMQTENRQDNVIESIQCCVSFGRWQRYWEGGNNDALGETEVPKVGK